MAVYYPVHPFITTQKTTRSLLGSDPLDEGLVNVIHPHVTFTWIFHGSNWNGTLCPKDFQGWPVQITSASVQSIIDAAE